MNSNFKLLTILAVIFLISSCGGGGGGAGPAAIINSFTVNTNTTPISTEVQLSWTSENSTGCTASGAWSGAKSTEGTESVTVSVVGSNTYNLTCSGGGGDASSSVSVTGTTTIAGITVDGYISGANIFIDTNDNFSYDSSEQSTTSGNNGVFEVQFTNGSLISLGGMDQDTQTQLNNFLLVHELSGYEGTKAITPVTSVAAFISADTDINTLLGIDSSIDISSFDPVANKGDNGINDYLYEKGNQLTVLAYSLQNLTNNLKTTTDSTQDYFKAIAEELNAEYASTSSRVNIEGSAFIEKVLDNLISVKTIELSADNKSNVISALSSLLPVVEVKSTDDLTASVIRFATNKFQTDILSISSGTADATLINNYKTGVLAYIADNQSINSADIEPGIISFDDNVQTNEDTSIQINVLANDSFTPSSSFTLTATSPSNGSISINGPSISYAPSSNYFGTDTFTYTVTQGTKSASAPVNITVLPINDAPVINIASTFNYLENSTDPVATVSATDVDTTDTVVLSLEGTDKDLMLLDGNILYFVDAPVKATKDTYSITLQATDSVETVTKDVTINIQGLSDLSGYEVPSSIDVIETKD